MLDEFTMKCDYDYVYMLQWSVMLYTYVVMFASHPLGPLLRANHIR